MRALSPSRPRHSRIRLALVLTFVLLITLMSLMTVSAQTSRQAVHDETAALEVQALLNEWRGSRGLLPLKRNPTLDALAMIQARYVEGLRVIPDGSAIHINNRGEGVKERARYPNINWADYGRQDRIAVGEIASVRTIQESVNFWKSSTPHHRSVTTGYYREVGIAALPHGAKGNYIFIVVMGARPNVLPALLNPVTGKIRLTYDSYTLTDSVVLLQTPDEIKLFDSEGRPLHDGWLPWLPEIDVPERAGDKLYIVSRSSGDPDLTVLSEVDLTDLYDTIMLPGYVPTVTPSPTPTLTPTKTYTPTPAISDTPTLTPTATLTPSPTPPPPPELLLLYDDTSFTVHNQSAVRVDLFQVWFVGERYTLTGAWWKALLPDNLLAGFQPGYCLQTFSGAVTASTPDVPTQCRRMLAVRANMRAEDRFWLTGDFEVRYKGDPVATCSQAAGRCEVDLPGLP